MRDRKNVFWGILFLLGACAVIAGQLGFLEGIGFWSILFSLVLAAVLIRGIIRRSWGMILFSIAFLCIVNDRLLGIEKLTPWPVLGAALLGTIGLNLLFPRRNWKHMDWHRIGMKNTPSASEDVEASASGDAGNSEYESHIGDDGAESIRCEVNFHSCVKYLQSSALSMYVWKTPSVPLPYISRTARCGSTKGPLMLMYLSERRSCISPLPGMWSAMFPPPSGA